GERGDPSIHVVPAALAVAEELAADGLRFFEALIAAYEITSRIGGATRVKPNLHSHGTWGTAGAAVAVARLLGHEPPAVRDVINLATSMSPANTWTPCFEGATIRNLYPGRAGLQGILATHLLDCGFTPIEDAPSDVYGTLLAEGFDPDAAIAGLGDDDRVAVYRIERNYFKFHACCYYNHPALDAVHRLVRDAHRTRRCDGASGSRGAARQVRHPGGARDRRDTGREGRRDGRSPGSAQGRPRADEARHNGSMRRLTCSIS